MTQHTNTREIGFEQLIEKALVGSTVKERRLDGITKLLEFADVQTPGDKFYWGLPKDFFKEFAIDERCFWSFLETSQGNKLKKRIGRGELKERIQNELKRKIEIVGVLEVLRNGLEVDNLRDNNKLKLFYPRPSLADSDASLIEYAMNQFSVTRLSATTSSILCA